MNTVVYDSPGFTLIQDSCQEWLLLEWRGLHDATTIEQCCGIVLENVRRTRYTKILDDASEILDGWRETIDWIEENFFRRLAAEGVQYVALVNAMDWPARQCMGTLLRHIEQPRVDMFDFDEVAQARTWLQAASTVPAR